MHTMRYGRRATVFGAAPAFPLDGNARARIWARAKGLSRWNPVLRCRILTPATMDVLKVLLFGYHRAGNGRVFPSYEAIAKAADRHRDTVCEAIRALETNGILTWCHRIKKVRVWVDGLFGRQSELRPQRSSNAYRFVDRLESHKTEFAAGPPNHRKKITGGRLDGGRVIGEPPQAPPEPAPPPAIAAEGSTASETGARLSAAERAAIVARMDAGTATKADWAAYTAQLDAMLYQAQP